MHCKFPRDWVNRYLVLIFTIQNPDQSGSAFARLIYIMLLLPITLAAPSTAHASSYHRRVASKEQDLQYLDESLQLVELGHGNGSTLRKIKNDGILPSALSPTIAEAEKSGKLNWTSIEGDDGTLTKFANIEISDYEEEQHKALEAFFHGRYNASASRLMRRDGRRRKAPSFRGLLRDLWDGYADLDDVRYGLIRRYDSVRDPLEDSIRRRWQEWFDEWVEKKGGYDFVCRDAGPHGWGSQKQSEMVNFCAFVGLPIVTGAATLAVPGIGVGRALAVGKFARIAGKSKLLAKVDHASRGMSISVMKHLGLNIAAKQRDGPTHFTMSQELCHRAVGEMLKRNCRTGEFIIDDDDGSREYFMDFDQLEDDYDCDGDYPDDYASEFDPTYGQDDYADHYQGDDRRGAPQSHWIRPSQTCTLDDGRARTRGRRVSPVAPPDRYPGGG